MFGKYTYVEIMTHKSVENMISCFMDTLRRLRSQLSATHCRLTSECWGDFCLKM